ncbi:MAG: ComEC/Rec2 family competence protein [Clostridium sp.]
MKINNPLPYVFASLSLSSILFALQIKNSWLAFIMASLFLCILIKYIDFKIILILLMFFGIGAINISNYFDYDLNENAIIRIDDVRENYYIGSTDGRSIYLFGIIKDAKEGQRYKVKGDFEKGRSFYNGSVGIINIDKVERMEDDFLSKIYLYRDNIFNNIKERLGSRKAALITSIAFGYTNYIDYEDKQDMGYVGLLHAIAVSGLHMGIVYSLLKKISNEKIAIILSLAYVIFTGCAVSTIRAYIMLLCISMATPLNRNYNKYASLSLAGIILLLLKPYTIFTAGFLLSFTATLGIMVFSRRISKSLYKLPAIIRDSLGISLSSQVFSVPVLIAFFNEITLNSILGNLIISPIITIIVVIGNLLALSMNFQVIFDYLCFISHYVIRVMDSILNSLMDISFKALLFDEKMVYVYVSMLVAVYFYKRKQKYVITLPIFTMIVVLISIYSINPKIGYLRDGALIISYRGTRELIILKQGVDIKSLKERYNVENVKRDCKSFIIDNSITFKENDGNFVVELGDKNYLLKVNNKKISQDYDIIDFKEGSFDEILILDDKIIELY